MVQTNFADKKVHFIGIGGISMSGLASILQSWGVQISGSDREDSQTLRHLAEQGMDVRVGHKAGQHGDATLVVFNSAIANDNPELAAARAAGVRCIRRDELLNVIMKQYKQSVGIAGVHGKTTCTSMTATILIECGKDPGVHVGAVLPLIGGSVRVGGGDIFVTESCEYKESFLAFPPTIGVILNIDADHLDYYSDIDHITQTFAKYVYMLPEEGRCIVNGDDPRAQSLLKAACCPGVTFGISGVNDWSATDIQAGQDGCHSFTLVRAGRPICPVRLSVPGRHNIYNALAAIAAAVACGVSVPSAAIAVGHYTGADRRFQRIGESNGSAVYHDYAHHPTEIRATLEAAALLPHGKLWCVFQPHTYTRTRALFNEFLTAFDQADTVVLTDIYAAREADPGDVSSQKLSDAINEKSPGKSVYVGDMQDAANYVKANAAPGDLIFIVGAGNIEKLGEMLTKN